MHWCSHSLWSYSWHLVSLYYPAMSSVKHASINNTQNHHLVRKDFFVSVLMTIGSSWSTSCVYLLDNNNSTVIIVVFTLKINLLVSSLKWDQTLGRYGLIQESFPISDPVMILYTVVLWGFPTLQHSLSDLLFHWRPPAPTVPRVSTAVLLISRNEEYCVDQ